MPAITFWCEVVKRLGINEIPESYEKFRQFVFDYERYNFRFAEKHTKSGMLRSARTLPSDRIPFVPYNRRHAVMTITPATNAHSDEIWEIFREVIASGDTYVFEPDLSREDALRYWLSADHHTFVVTDNEHVYGTYILKKNHPGRGSHVANASYMVSSEARGKGLGSLMCEHSLEEARRLGFSAMQFNIVVSTNAAAISLWKKHGFGIVGTLPKVFRHATQGLVDAFVMHRFL